MSEKPCTTCGRVITWRKKWEKNWDEVKYCGEQCRRNKPDKRDAEIEMKILKLLEGGGLNGGISLSEVACALWPTEEELRQGKMESIKQAARRLVHRGLVVMTLNGVVVDPSTAKGPIRIKGVRRESH